MTVHVITEDLNLINETQDGRVVGSNNVRIDGGAAVGEVVTEDSGVGGVGGDELANPVQPTCGGPAGQGRVSKGV